MVRTGVSGSWWLCYWISCVALGMNTRCLRIRGASSAETRSSSSSAASVNDPSASPEFDEDENLRAGFRRPRPNDRRGIWYWSNDVLDMSVLHSFRGVYSYSEDIGLYSWVIWLWRFGPRFKKLWSTISSYSKYLVRVSGQNRNSQNQHLTSGKLKSFILRSLYSLPIMYRVSWNVPDAICWGLYAIRIFSAMNSAIRIGRWQREGDEPFKGDRVLRDGLVTGNDRRVSVGDWAPVRGHFNRLD